MILRLLSAALKTQSDEFPVVTLTGPRQSGKTTLVRTVFPKRFLHGSTVASDWARGLAFFQKVSGTALAHAKILHGGANFLPCGIASAIPWTRHAEKKCFANL